MEIRKYRNKLSEPLRDRIDIFIKMDESKSDERVSSAELFAQVLVAFRAQKERGQKKLNGKLDDSEIMRFCTLKSAEAELLDMATQRYGLSYRGRQKILKVARTIADLQDCKEIAKEHLLEALSYRIIN